jgi:hypothetical protein
MLEHLYAQAAREQADLVSFGFCRVDDAGEKSGFNVDTPGVINLRQQNGWSIKYNIWAKLISRQLLMEHAIRFEPVWGEDALFSITLYCHASRLVITDEVYYCYRINQQGASLMQWDSAKLFGTVRWFVLAMKLIRESVLFERRPDVLQSIIIERLKMLFNRLGPMAQEILADQERVEYFGLWAKCFEAIDAAYFNVQFQSDPDAGLYRVLLEKVSRKDIAGLDTFFKSQAYQLRSAGTVRPVRLTQQQARQLGQDLLQVNKAHIRCDFGGGTVVTLPKDRAHQLATQLIANRNAHINLKFD